MMPTERLQLYSMGEGGKILGHHRLTPNMY